jgi:hypothetical protein
LISLQAFLYLPDLFPCRLPISLNIFLSSGLFLVKTLKNQYLKTRKCLPLYYFLTLYRYSIKSIIIVFFLLSTQKQAYPLDSISFKQQSDGTTTVPSKIDLTKLSRGEIYKIVHNDFILQFFFNNNRDIFGFIFKRKPGTGIMAHLCLYRSCEETPYDLRNVIAKPFETPYDKTFFSIKFPQKLQYKFQGLEFLTHK